MNAFAPVFPDQFGTGQATVALIKLAATARAMAEAAPEIIDTRDLDPAWRAMRIRQFKAAQAEHATARRVSIMHERLM